MEIFTGFLLFVFLQLIGSLPSAVKNYICSKVKKKSVFLPSHYEGVWGMELQLLSFWVSAVNGGQ